MPTIPTDLIDALRRGRGAVFLGAITSADAGVPNWEEFVSSLATELLLGIPTATGSQFGPHDPGNISQYYENRFGRRKLVERLEELLRPAVTGVGSKVHDFIAQLPCELFYTTNFDELLEDSLRKRGLRFNVVVSDGAARAFADRRGRLVRKLHGSISQPETLVITRSDYAEFTKDAQFTINRLRNDLGQYTFLFIGYDLTDPDFNSIYDNVMLSMGRMRSPHFMCLTDASEFETLDLRQRGIQVIDLAEWPGASHTEKLESFLAQLAEETSEIVHLERFYGEIGRDGEIPIVISSSLSEVEKFVYFPDCDVAVAQQLERALTTIGRRPKLVADKAAIRTTDQYLEGDVILVCSPFGNAFSKEVFDLLESQSSNVCVRFREDDSGRYIEDVRSGQKFRADDPSQADGSGSFCDYAVIARYASPWTKGKRIFVMAGIYSIGTHAIATFLSNPMRYRELPWRGDDVAAVIKATYTSHDPYDYRYDVEFLGAL